MGCGSSTGVPRAACVLDGMNECETCCLAMEGSPETNRNWRGNPSLLIRFVPPPSTPGAPSPPVLTFQIDCCKTFLQGVLRWFPRLGVCALDAVLLTHDHADAVLGLDDIRSLQKFHGEEETEGRRSTPEHLPVLCDARTMSSLRGRFGYLMPPLPPAPCPAPAVDSPHAETELVERKVAQLKWGTVRPFVPFDLHGLQVLPLPVLHGEDYVSLGFMIGSGLGQSAEHEAVVYISDVSRIPQLTWTYLCTGQLPDAKEKASDEPSSNSSNVSVSPPPSDSSSSPFSPASSPFDRYLCPTAHPLPSPPAWRPLPDFPASPGPSAPRISLLIVDALFPDREHNTHFSLQQTLEFVQRLQPRRALLTGMSDLFEYERHSAELRRLRAEGSLTVDVQLAYDGMRIPMRL